MDTRSGTHLLMLRVERADLQGVKECLQKFPQYLDMQNKSGNSALTVAIRLNNLLIMQELLSFNAKINLKNKAGQTPLYIATFQQKLEAVRILLSFGADASITDQKGWNPLMIAVQKGNQDIVLELLSKGNSNLFQKNLLGETVFDLAKNKEMLEILVEGSQLDIEEIEGGLGCSIMCSLRGKLGIIDQNRRLKSVNMSIPKREAERIGKSMSSEHLRINKEINKTRSNFDKKSGQHQESSQFREATFSCNQIEDENIFVSGNDRMQLSNQKQIQKQGHNSQEPFNLHVNNQQQQIDYQNSTSANSKKYYEISSSKKKKSIHHSDSKTYYEPQSPLISQRNSLSTCASLANKSSLVTPIKQSGKQDSISQNQFQQQQYLNSESTASNNSKVNNRSMQSGMSYPQYQDYSNSSNHNNSYLSNASNPEVLPSNAMNIQSSNSALGNSRCEKDYNNKWEDSKVDYSNLQNEFMYLTSPEIVHSIVSRLLWRIANFCEISQDKIDQTLVLQIKKFIQEVVFNPKLSLIEKIQVLKKFEESQVHEMVEFTNKAISLKSNNHNHNNKNIHSQVQLVQSSPQNEIEPIYQEQNYFQQQQQQQQQQQSYESSMQQQSLINKYQIIEEIVEQPTLEMIETPKQQKYNNPQIIEKRKNLIQLENRQEIKQSQLQYLSNSPKDKQQCVTTRPSSHKIISNRFHYQFDDLDQNEEEEIAAAAFNALISPIDNSLSLPHSIEINSSSSPYSLHQPQEGVIKNNFNQRIAQNNNNDINEVFPNTALDDNNKNNSNKSKESFQDSQQQEAILSPTQYVTLSPPDNLLISSLFNKKKEQSSQQLQNQLNISPESPKLSCEFSQKLTISSNQFSDRFQDQQNDDGNQDSQQTSQKQKKKSNKINIASDQVIKEKSQSLTQEFKEILDEEEKGSCQSYQSKEYMLKEIDKNYEVDGDKLNCSQVSQDTSAQAVLADAYELSPTSRNSLQSSQNPKMKEQDEAHQFIIKRLENMQKTLNDKLSQINTRKPKEEKEEEKKN